MALGDRTDSEVAELGLDALAVEAAGVGPEVRWLLFYAVACPPCAGTTWAWRLVDRLVETAEAPERAAWVSFLTHWRPSKPRDPWCETVRRRFADCPSR
jgi:hypothetical protein